MDDCSALGSPGSTLHTSSEALCASRYSGPVRGTGGSLPVGTTVAGRYRIARFLAAGGMGEVYQASDALLGEPVALKLLRPELGAKPEAQERFASEIRLARRITHPNVCRVFDVGMDGPHLFLTMELHHGETLATLLARRGPLPRGEVEALLPQLLAGVGAAHAAAVIHSDLKPSNVIFAGGGERLVITDFGLAVPCCTQFGCPCSGVHLIGTPAYAAPELLEGGTASEATDLFGIGVILFEMLVGHAPWRCPTAVATARARLEGEPPSPRALRPELDPVWDEAIRACLARDPSRRPRDVQSLAWWLGLGLGSAASA